MSDGEVGRSRGQGEQQTGGSGNPLEVGVEAVGDGLPLLKREDLITTQGSVVCRWCLCCGGSF